MDPSVNEENVLRVIKDLPFTEKHKVDSFNEKVKPLIVGIKGI